MSESKAVKAYQVAKHNFAVACVNYDAAVKDDSLYTDVDKLFRRRAAAEAALDEAVKAKMVEMGRKARAYQPLSFSESVSWQGRYERMATELLESDQ